MLDVSGEIDGIGLEEFKEGLLKAEEAGDGAVILNFTEVVFISSSGLGALVAFYKRLRAKDRQLAVYGLRDVIQQVFEIVRLNKVITLAGSEEEACRLVQAVKE